MKLLEPLLKVKSRDFVVIKAHGAGPRRLFVALEAYAHDTKKAATCIISVDLDTLAVALVHEVAGSSVDYLHVDGWHGLLQRDAVIELAGGKPVVTKAKLGKDGVLAAIARMGDTTLVGGTKRVGNYAIDGFVARVTGGTLAMRLETSKVGEPGPIGALHTNGDQICAGSGVVRDGKVMLFPGDSTTFENAIPAGSDQIYSVHMKRDGSIMVGARGSAGLYEKGQVRDISGLIGRGYGVTEFRGDEYWMSHDGVDQLFLWRRSGAKLSKKFKTKFHYTSYRHLDGTPDARLTATNDLLVVTNGNRIHVFDGKAWSQLAIQPDVKKLIKRMPTAMKK